MTRAVLCILPGLDGTARLLTPFLDAVTPAFASTHAIAYPHDVPMDYAALDAYVRARLPQDAPFVLLGESFSGPVAIAIAAKPPPNLIGLALSTTFARAPVPWASPFAPLTSFAPVRAAPMPLLSAILLGRWATPALRRDLSAALDAVAPDVLRARAAAAMRVDTTARLADVAVPTLCLRARHDRLLRASATRELLDGLRDAREVAIDGPHLLLQTRTDAAAGEVMRIAAALG